MSRLFEFDAQAACSEEFEVLAATLGQPLRNGDVLVCRHEGTHWFAIVVGGSEVTAMVDDDVLTIPREATRVVDDALAHFGVAIDYCQRNNVVFSIVLYPTDKGLAKLVTPVDPRAYAYHLTRYGDEAFELDVLMIDCTQATRGQIGCVEDWCESCVHVVLKDERGQPASAETAGELLRASIAEALEPMYAETAVLASKTAAECVLDASVLRQYEPYYVQTRRRPMRIQYDDRSRSEHVARVGDVLVTADCRLSKRADMVAALDRTCDAASIKQHLLARIALPIDRVLMAVGESSSAADRHSPGRLEPLWRHGSEFRQPRAAWIACNATLVFAPLELPRYVLLWIIDWLPGMHWTPEYLKVRWLERAHASIRDMLERRINKRRAVATV